jgi:hypothetical protein
MKDCDCQKNKMEDDWLGDGEVGDDFLQERKYDMIESIIQNLNLGKINDNAIFNKKLDEDQLDNLILDDAIIDYSYVETPENDTLVDYQYEKKEMEEEEKEMEEEEEEEETEMEEEETEMEEEEEEEETEMEEEETEMEEDTQYTEEKKLTSRKNAVRYLNDLI